MDRLKSVSIPALLLLAAPGSDASASDSGSFENFYGFWIDRGAVAKDRDDSNAGVGSDLAIWQSTTGFNLSWRNSQRHPVARTRIHFSGSDEAHIFDLKWSNLRLAHGKLIRARFDGESLLLNLPEADNNDRLVARYDISIHDGYMTFKYSLWHGDELREKITRSLRRAKVIM